MAHGVAGVLIVACALLAPLLLVAGLAVAAAGRASVLNSVDYARVDDPVAMHRWVGRRLVAIAVGTGGLGAGAAFAPALAPLLGAVLASWLFVGIGMVAAGTTKFLRRA
jgi:hypothetical protein